MTKGQEALGQINTILTYDDPINASDLYPRLDVMEKDLKAFDILKEYFDIQIVETDSKEIATIIISRKGDNSALHFTQKLITDKEKINLLKEMLE